MARMTARQKQSRKASRNKAQKKFFRSLKVYTLSIVGILSLVVTAAGSWWLVDSGWLEKAAQDTRESWHAALAQAGFGLRDIYIQGREKTGQEEVLAAIGLERGDSVFSVSLEEMRERIEHLSTVRHATVERMLPATLFVTLEERVPVALWQHKGTFKLVDMDGVVLKEDPKAYPNLMIVVGEGAPDTLAELFALLAKEPELARQISAAVRVGQRRWNLTFTGGVEVMLPDTQEERALAKLAGMQRSQRILEKAVSAIDMRLDERIFITLPDEKAVTPLTISKEGASET